MSFISDFIKTFKLILDVELGNVPPVEFFFDNHKFISEFGFPTSFVMSLQRKGAIIGGTFWRYTNTSGKIVMRRIGVNLQGNYVRYDEDKTVDCICCTIGHEYLHYAISEVIGPADEARRDGEEWIIKEMGFGPMDLRQKEQWSYIHDTNL